MTILITGGAGSLGVCLVSELQKDKNNKIRIFDNNEHALATMKINNTNHIRKLYGSITDKDRVRRAMKDVDLVIHCAAMKNIDITEYNVSELIKTNIVGTDNIISAAVEANVKKIMFISSDKAVEATSIYGSSKLIGEYTALNYNQMNYPNSKVSVFRSGNFLNSRGNVLEAWETQLKQRLPLIITDVKCMRYFIPTEIAASTILHCITKMEGGEIFVPGEEIMPELLIIDLASKFLDMYHEPSKFNLIGLRKGEKLSESLFSKEESLKKYYNEELKCWVIV